MGGEGHDQTGGIDQCKGGGFSCFPSRQCSIRLCNAATTNLSHSSLSRKTKVQSSSPSLSLSLASTYDRAPHTTHPASISITTNPTKMKIYKPTIFSINHRSAPWLVTTPIIDLGLDILVDISCIGMYVMQAYTSRQHQARLSEDLLIENERCKSSNSELNKNEKRSIACGGEFKVTGRI